MKRINSIDVMRGLFIFLMVLYHLLDWWLIDPDRWIIVILFSFLGSFAFSGFLFVSGFSAAIAYKSRAKKVESSPDISMTHARNIYLLRALLLYVIGLGYNIAIAIARFDIKWVWSWFILQTIPISLLLAWPLFRIKKYLRIALGIGLLVANELLSPFAHFYLLSYTGPPNFFSVFFYIFYHPVEAYTIFSYFAMFIFGTVIGDFFFDINIIESPEERKNSIKRVFLKTILIAGIISTAFGMVYRFHEFLYRLTISAMFYSIGTVLLVLAFLLYLEEFKQIRTKKSYRFFFFFSYYSFTIYLGHDPLLFLFYKQLTVQIFWFIFIGVIVLLVILLRFLHKKVGPYASLKAVLGIIGLTILNKIEQRKNRK